MNKNILRVITLIAAIFFVLWLGGLGWAMADYYTGKPNQITATKAPDKAKENGKELTVVAIGDSLTRGTGDESGKGYVGDVMDELKTKTKKPVKLLNLGINGQRSDQLRTQLGQKEVQRQIQRANIVLMTIGGNDLFRGGQGLADYQSDKLQIIEKSYLQNLTAILKQIRASNPDARVFFVGLYNPFMDLKEGKDISKVIRRINYESAEVSASFPKVVFVPTFDLFELKVNDYLYSDKFHPNTKGHRLIAERVASLITW